MDDETKILPSAPKPVVSGTGRQACLIHIYPTGPAMGTRFSLGSTPMMLGRDADCHIRIEDESVSRHHACIQLAPDGYHVLDLRSTNGTFVNDEQVTRHALQDGDYLRIGNAIYRFLASDNVESEYHEEIYRLTILDSLTGIHNKRFFLEFLGRSLSNSIRYRRPLSVILFDLDHFKSINDRFGHMAGDYTLRELADVVRQQIRREDLFARYGGEEFAIVLPETERTAALELAERLRACVERHLFEYDGQRFDVTISLGVAAITGEQWLTTSEIIEQADARLYQAKGGGRNRVVG
ncbi:MAG: GGDEF domain-containing protein [Gemmataceae bacterium]